MVKQLRFVLGMIAILLWQRVSAQLNAQCHPAQALVDLDINNVRAAILTGGDLWWDLSQATYEIPKGSRKHSIFSGGLWIGGVDFSGQLHVAAMTYRQTGNDFWPGPLDTASATTSDSVCREFDRHWKVDRAEVECFLANRTDPNYTIPESILTWPGNGNTARGQSRWLAPFHDADGDNIYDPLNGDYPGFTLNGQNNCNNDLLGDQAIWWVFNDRGNNHSETGSPGFGIEVQAMAFAYRSQNVKLDDATFYRYTMINRSSNVYNQVWFGQYTDFDLGDAFDDYVGCDVGRGLGYCYNGDANDGASSTPVQGTYGANPPAVGIDFLQGPLAIPGDNKDNDHDFVVDESGERIQLSNSVYYYSTFTIQGNPQTGMHYYYFLQSRWQDGSHMTYGGGASGGTVWADYRFPGDSDPYGWGTYGVPQAPWDETSSGNLADDRRQLNSAGPFNMNPGQVEVITIGVPWARDTNGNNLEAVDRLKEADDYIQALFDNCFAIPCADQQSPEITFNVNDKHVDFTLYSEGTAWSWDFGDGQHSNLKFPSHEYSEPGDYTVCVQVTTPCGVLSDCDTVHIADKLFNCGPSLFRIEGQGNGKAEMDLTAETVNLILDSSYALFPMYQPMHGPVTVSYEDYDALRDGDYRIAFDTVGNNAHWKMWMVGGTDTAYSDSTIGSGNVQRIAMWGLGVQVTNVPKIGYGTNPDRNGYLTSSISFSDPAHNWLSGFKDTEYDDESNWIRGGTKTGTGTCVADFNDRFQGSSPLDPQEDFENVVNGTWAPYRICAYAPTPTQATICYPLGAAWSAVPAAATLNKIENLANVDIVITADKTKWTRCPVLETGAAHYMNQNARAIFYLRSARSVDKNGNDVVHGGLSDPTNPEAADYIGNYGMGWFPGYAINLETGERLNMAFGENSAFVSENGRDMQWNPTINRYFTMAGNLWGGCHYIYVFGHNGDATYTSGPLIGELKDIPRYDAGYAAWKILSSDSTANYELKEVYADAMWTGIPLLNPGHTLLECDVTIRLRVQKPYAPFATTTSPQNHNYPLYGFSVIRDNISCNMYNHDVLVYPNPFVDECIVQFSNLDYRKTDLKLYDIRGRLVRVYEDVTDDRIVISGAGLDAGVYIWTLQVEGEAQKSGRLILR